MCLWHVPVCVLYVQFLSRHIYYMYYSIHAALIVYMHSMQADTLMICVHSLMKCTVVMVIALTGLPAPVSDRIMGT